MLYVNLCLRAKAPDGSRKEAFPRHKVMYEALVAE